MKFRHIVVDEQTPLNSEHLRLGLPLIEDEVLHLGSHPLLRIFTWLLCFMLLYAVIYAGYLLIHTQGSWANVVHSLQVTFTSYGFWSAFAVGLLAQTVDGALGMAYGITSTSFLLVAGHSPLVASASVHIAEVFTTGVSGLAHIKMKNVNYHLFIRLLIPGIIGAIVGALIINKIDGKILKPYISAYLLIMGIYIISKVFRPIIKRKELPKFIAPLALFGGFVDTVGGGGWGPVVTTSLVGSGNDPRTTIGSVNFAEFFLTFGSALTFSLLIESSPWQVIAGLVCGGLFAAPFAALLTKKFSPRSLLMLVGSLICLVSTFNIYKAIV